MTDTDQLTFTLQKWDEVFMHRSFHEFKRYMDENNLSMSQVTTLMRLYHHGKCGISGIGEHLGVTNAAASQLVDRLVQQGLLERTENSADRRARQLALTERGQALMEAGIAVRRHWLEKLVNVLSPEEQEKVAPALRILIDAADRL